MKNIKLIVFYIAFAIAMSIGFNSQAQQKTFSANKIQISINGATDMEVVLDDSNQFMIQNNSAGICIQREQLAEATKEAKNKYIADMTAILTQNLMLDLDATTMHKTTMNIATTDCSITNYHDNNSGLEISFGLVSNTKNPKEVLFFYSIYEKGYEIVVNNIIKSLQIN